MARVAGFRTPGLLLTLVAVAVALVLSAVAIVLVLTQHRADPGANAVVPSASTDFAAVNARIAGAAVQPDAEGAFFEAASGIAAVVGVHLDTDYDAVFRACPDRSRNASAIASVCPLDLTRIFVNTDHPAYAAFVRRTAFVDTIRHELAHVQIARICGSVDPPITGERFEAVTSSYAAQELGLDREQWDREALDGYTTDADSDRIAAAIADGDCG